MAKGFYSVYALIMILFGAVGAMLFFGSAWYVNENGITAKAMGSSVEEEFIAMSKTMNDASIAAKNAGKSILNARDSLVIASQFASNTKESFYAISGFMSFAIPFTEVRPLQGAGQYFKTSGDNLESLSLKLNETADSFSQNAQDFNKLSQDFSDMSTKLDEVSGKINSGASSLPEKVIVYFLVYMGFLHLVIMFAGLNFMKLN